MNINLEKIKADIAKQVKLNEAREAKLKSFKEGVKQ